LQRDLLDIKNVFCKATEPRSFWPPVDGYDQIIENVGFLLDARAREMRDLEAAEQAESGIQTTHWQDAMKRAEDHVRAHGGALPSVKRLADIVGCSRATTRKAIANSPYLKARQAEADAKATPAGRTVPLSDALLESTAQTTEAAPDQLADLIAEQGADQRRDARQARKRAVSRR